MTTWRELPSLGARVVDDRCEVRVWAPERRAVTLRVFSSNQAHDLAMAPEPGGFFATTFAMPAEGEVTYAFCFDGSTREHLDPMSLAAGVRSRVERLSSFAWRDEGWSGLTRAAAVLCEVHVGTASETGDFDGLIPQLGALRGLGVTALELMPVATFAGARNWGYDGVLPLAPHDAYGGADGLRRLVDAAHAAGLGVMLDVVYNHLGPEGLDLAAFTPRYFSRSHGTPWGNGFAFDEPVVRAMVLHSVARWIGEFHLDGLRLDATWCMHDDAPHGILAEIGEVAREAAAGRSVLIIAEDNRGLASLTEPIAAGGAGLDAQWSDDVHDALRVAFEAPGDDPAGRIADVLTRGWRHPDAVDRGSLVAFLQNHDQVGNRPENKRFGAMFGAAAQRAAAALVLLGPAIPMIFMGEASDAPEPFHFFTDFSPALGRRVALGRAREHARMGVVPSPQSVRAFRRSVLRAKHAARPAGQAMLLWYRALLELRAKHPCFQGDSNATTTCTSLGTSVVVMLRSLPDGRTMAAVVCLSGALAAPVLALLPRGRWRPLAWSEERRFGGTKPSADAALTVSGVRMNGPSALVLEGERSDL